MKIDQLSSLVDEKEDKIQFITSQLEVNLLKFLPELLIFTKRGARQT